MTVSSSTSNATFPGNGVATVFPLPFRFFDNGDINAYLLNDTTGDETPLTLGINYTLLGAGEPEVDGNPVSALTMAIAPASGYTLVVERDMDPVQETDIINQARFYPEIHENVFDRLVMLIQQSFSLFSRALKRPVGKSYFDAESRVISNVADPLTDQDAATRGWASRYFGDLIDQASGIINTTTGILYDTGTLFDHLRFGVSRTVDSIASLRNLSGARNQRATVLGYYAKGDGGGGTYYIDPADTTSLDNGGTIIVGNDGSRWKMLHNGTFRPEQFGAKADGTNDWAPLHALMTFIRSIGGGVLDLGPGGKSFQLIKPLRLYSNLRITGRGYIIAMPGFTSDVSFPTYGTEVQQTYNTLLYFNDGTHADDPTNFGYRGLEIDAGVEIYGNYHCDNGLIMEGITNYRISGRFQRFNSIGVYAKYYCWGGRINAHISNCLVAPLKMGEASNGIDLNGLQLFGDANNPTYLLQVVGDNNGINLTGAFIEKGLSGIHCSGLTGPMSISGVDFEDCFGDLITIDGTGLVGRAAGPVTISGCFMEATNVAVKCINAVAIVTGCRIRDTPLAFSTSGDRAKIYDIANEFEGTVTRSIGGNIISDIGVSIGRKEVNYLPNALLSAVDSYTIENNSYSFNPNLAVNLLSFSSIVADAPTQRMLSSSTWETRELRNGSVFGVMGLKIDYTTGAKRVLPRGDNDHSLGDAGLRFSVVYAGTGTINTSDERSKEQIQDIDPAAIRAMKKVKFRQYKFTDAAELKGENARWHFGVVAQQLKEAFESEGLDAFEYGLLCLDEWPAEEEKIAIYDNDGNLLQAASEALAAGSRYGIRYDELYSLLGACVLAGISGN